MYLQGEVSLGPSVRVITFREISAIEVQALLCVICPSPKRLLVLLNTQFLLETVFPGWPSTSFSKSDFRTIVLLMRSVAQRDAYCAVTGASPIRRHDQPLHLLFANFSPHRPSHIYFNLQST